MKTILCLFLFFTAIHLVAEELTFTSGPGQTDLIELFTSEGCSSCPPADQRMNALSDDKGLWVDFVPVAFHVDYWNDLGWNDRFSAPAFTTRQRGYSAEWKTRRIFTPCFVVNGRVDANITKHNSSGKPGPLKAVLNQGEVTVTFAPSQPPRQKLAAWIVPLSGSESNAVTSGENRGRKLEHNFVALGLNHQNMVSSNGVYSTTLPLPKNDETKAVAIWITEGHSLKPVQATGGWLK
jgi:hypothetical protein